MILKKVIGFGDLFVSKSCHFMRVSLKGWKGGWVVKSGIIQYTLNFMYAWLHSIHFLQICAVNTMIALMGCLAASTTLIAGVFVSLLPMHCNIMFIALCVLQRNFVVL